MRVREPGLLAQFWEETKEEHRARTRVRREPMSRLTKNKILSGILFAVAVIWVVGGIVGILALTNVSWWLLLLFLPWFVVAYFVVKFGAWHAERLEKGYFNGA